LRAVFGALFFLAFAAYSVAYFVVAFTSSSTEWWWWFVPLYGTYKIFAASVALGIFHLGILALVFVGGYAYEEWVEV
jgi:hypothetical protein